MAWWEPYLPHFFPRSDSFRCQFSFNKISFWQSTYRSIFFSLFFFSLLSLVMAYVCDLIICDVKAVVGVHLTHFHGRLQFIFYDNCCVKGHKHKHVQCTCSRAQREGAEARKKEKNPISCDYMTPYRTVARQLPSHETFIHGVCFWTFLRNTALATYEHFSQCLWCVPSQSRLFPSSKIKTHRPTWPSESGETDILCSLFSKRLDPFAFHPFWALKFHVQIFLFG